MDNERNTEDQGSNSGSSNSNYGSNSGYGSNQRYNSNGQRPMNNRKRKKVCAFCVDKIDYIDYKNTVRLNKCVSDRAKIPPRRISGTCAKHQRQLTTAIKRARQVALMPYISD
jgi:ribosomal protein S18